MQSVVGNLIEACHGSTTQPLQHFVEREMTRAASAMPNPVRSGSDPEGFSRLAARVNRCAERVAFDGLLANRCIRR